MTLIPPTQPSFRSISRRMLGRCLLAASLGALAASQLGLLHAADPKEKRELLAMHQTVAEFSGVAYQECRGRTSECPNKCGNSGDFASFRILKYVVYNKPGEYGDEKQTMYAFQVEDNMKNLKVSKEIKDVVASLKKGDYVLLDWRHDYVTKDGSSSPERPIQKLEKISKEQAEKLTGGLPSAPAASPAPAPSISPASGARRF